MAGKRELWRELWRDATELLREYHDSTHKEFVRIFKTHGILKRYLEIADIDSMITTDILGGCRMNGVRAAYPVDSIRNGKPIKVWRLTETLTKVHLKQVRKSYRRGARDMLVVSNQITKRLARQTGEQLPLFDVSLLDDAPLALPPGPDA